MAAVSAIPVVGGPFAIVLQATIEADRRRMAQLAAAARDEVGDDDRLQQRLESNEQLRDMLLESLTAAAKTSNEAKRIAMGRVLAQAVNDDAAIDDSAAMLQALAVLDSPHFALLAKMANLELSDLGGGFRVPEPYKSALIAQGVATASVRGIGPIGFTVEGINEFGHRLLQWLREAEADRPPAVAG